MINPEAHLSDAELERLIDFQHGLLVTSITPAEHTAAWEEMKRLIDMRSPERVEQMEREIGIRK